MLRIRLAASGEEVVALDAGGFEALVMQHGSTVIALKIYLAQKHFQKKFSRYQLRILREGDSTALKDEESITLPLDLQLVLMNHLPPNEERDRCFFQSCRDGEEDEVHKCLKALQNPNVGSDGQMVLMWAVKHYWDDNIVDLLLEAGADTEAKDDSGLTALHIAAIENDVPLADILLQFGADIEAVAGGGVGRPLHLACFHNSVNTAGLLLSLRADMEAEDVDGQRPLHWAARNNSGDDLDVVELLVEAGVKRKALNKEGNTAAQIAMRKGYREIAHFLQNCKRRRLS